MTNRMLAWLRGQPKLWVHLQQTPMRRLAVLLVAVFLLFSVIGFYVDLMSGATLPYSVIVVTAALSGLNGVTWVLVLARGPVFAILLLAIAEYFNNNLTRAAGFFTEFVLHSPAVSQEQGIRFAATSIMVLVIASYICFSRYMAINGKEAYRLKTELTLAHGIQKTLVPPIYSHSSCFEIYGISEPSDKVGGDLVDLVQLPNGDAVAYLADIAGHGLQAGILMGMLKTAARTALTDAGPTVGDPDTGASTLSSLMSRLNIILPQVKEAHMYATFTALRLNADGLSYYGMAASPPLLHWVAADKTIARVEEQQFPLGLLPVAEFGASAFTMAADDVVLIATDGILEVTSSRGIEFGAASLEAVVAAHINLSLPEMAEAILKTVRAYGKQLDDQTLLLVRRNRTANAN